MEVNGFDIIGDIHGHADALHRLLKKLGYNEKEGLYSHSHRQVVFLGDFIDRGDEQAKVIDIVKTMVDNNTALAVMGNHEFNAICYHTNNPKTGKPLRENSDKNKEQHKAFLKEYVLGEERTNEVINWFKTLPLFIETDGFRVVHACWNTSSIDTIDSDLTSYKTITDDFLIKASQKNTPEFQAVETLLKGLEIKLPEGNTFLDQYKHTRDTIRVKWWAKEAKTYRDYALVHNDVRNDISTELLPKTMTNPEYIDQIPVFFGHYWFTGEPKILKENVACLDYSVGNKEKLVCYRWNTGDKELSNNKFCMVEIGKTAPIS